MSANSISTIEIHFTQPFNTKKIFDFIILPTSMPLYRGFFLIPAIVKVNSSDLIRKVGTRDEIFNSDGSSHISTTKEFINPSKYALEIGEIKVIGLKKMLASVIIGFKEDWELTSVDSQTTKIIRKLFIIHRSEWWARLLIASFIKPQLTCSLHLHHWRLKRALKE